MTALWAYVARRVLFMVPTLIGIVTISFIIIQFVPGGPDRPDPGAHVRRRGRCHRRISGSTGASDAPSAGLVPTGELDPEQVKQLEKQYGFDKPVLVRYFKMLWDFARFDLGTSFFKDKPVVELILSKLPVSISLGLWTTLLTYLIAIPWASARRCAPAPPSMPGPPSRSPWAMLSPASCSRCCWSCCSRAAISGTSSPRAVSPRDDWDQLSLLGKIGDYLWHITLPVTAMVIGAFANLTMLTKNSILDEVNKQYVLNARAKGLSERGVLYGHIFRNAMLIVIAGFPAAFVSVLFSSSLLIEVIFSLDGLGLLGFEATMNRDFPLMLGSLFFFSLLGLVTNLLGDIAYVLVDPRIDFERRDI